MVMKRITILLAATAGAGLMAYADPPHNAQSHGGPPGLEKQGKIPPGQAKKMWNRGDYLPSDYRYDHDFNDWHRYDLKPAPPGYRWVIVDGDAYLMQTTTGLVAQAIIDLLD
jgi:Ni/Co efflux regulator RcnB